MIIDAQLHQVLRALKLSGMLETLDARLAQARAGELDQIEFLQVLCHDEIARRESQAITGGSVARSCRQAAVTDGESYRMRQARTRLSRGGAATR